MLTTIDEVVSTGLRISTIDQDDTLPDIAEAIEKHLKPVLGNTLIIALQQAYLILTAQRLGEADPLLVTLLPYVQKPLAAFAYLDELPATHARITSAGVRRTSTDGMPTAYKWEYEKVEAYLEERAYRTLETLMAYLDAHFEDYQEWMEETIIAERKSLLIKSGGQMQQFFPVQYPYLSWFRFLPFLRELTQTYIIATFGETFYNELLGVTANDATTDPTSDASKYMLYNLQMALVNLTIMQACKKMSVNVSGNGLTLTKAVYSQSSGEQSAEKPELKMLATRCHDDGKMYLRRAINYANTNAGSSLFNSYFTSVHYTAPANRIIDRKNDQRKVFRF